MTNLYRITLSSFLAYFIMSGMLAPIGIISGPMASAFDLPVTDITARFSWLTVGIFVGAVMALVAFQWLRIRTVLLLVYGAIAACLVSLPLTNTLDGVGLRLGLVGVGCGVGLPAAALVIARSFNADRRASMLVITDGCFSVAGVVCAWLAISLLALDIHWSAVYVCVGGVAVLVCGLALTSRYPEDEQHAAAEPAPSDWPLSAWLCIAALATYTLAQNTILWWLPQYAQVELGAGEAGAGQLVGQFWSGMFVAQVFVAWWVFKIGVARLLVLAAICTLAFSIPLWVLQDMRWMTIWAALWGFANLGLLKVVLSFASQFTAVASPRLVSSLLLGATTGTAISPWISSQLVSAGDAGVALKFGSFAYLLMLVLLLVSVRMSRRAQAAAVESPPV